jgi:sulfite exporter TauE/SafE
MGIIAAAFMAGLVGSPHCIGMCGGFAVACGGTVGGSAAWHVGRLTTYAALGAIAGAVGSALPGPGWLVAAVSLLLIVWFSAMLAGFVPEPKFRLPGLQAAATRLLRRGGIPARFLFGLLNGLLPCGLVYAALAIPIAAADPELGAAAMIAFGVGTVPALAAVTLGLRKAAMRDIRVRRALAAGVLIAGLWSIGMREGFIGGGMKHPEMAEPPAEMSEPPASEQETP